MHLCIYSLISIELLIAPRNIFLEFIALCFLEGIASILCSGDQILRVLLGTMTSALECMAIGEYQLSLHCTLLCPSEHVANLYRNTLVLYLNHDAIFKLQT